MDFPEKQDPLEEVPFAEVLKHGDPNNWTFIGKKKGSSLPAKSTRAVPLTLKVYEIYEDEYGEIIELHYFRHSGGTVTNVTVIS